MTSITIFDGSNTIGGNKIYVEENNKGVFLDFGKNFKKYRQFFQEYLQPRASRGIYDLIKLNLLPKVNIYRKDLVSPDLDIFQYPSLNVEGVLITHAHQDHSGNVGFLDTDISIVGSPVTLALIKAMEEITGLNPELEVAFYSEKKMGFHKMTLISERSSCKGRPLLCTQDYDERFENFMRTSMKYAPDRKTGELKEIECHDMRKLSEHPLSFEIQSFPVDHSIYGAVGYLLKGDMTIAYTGDFRLHGKHGNLTRNFIQAARSASILIIEGTRVNADVHEETEEKVKENCLGLIENTNELVIADFSSRNFERLECFQDIAKKVGRKIVVPSKQAYLLKALEQADGINRLSDLLIFEEYKASRNYWEVNFLSEHSNQYISPSEISKNPSKYILCFSLYDIKHVLDMRLKGGLYIYSSSEAFEEEDIFDFMRLNHWLHFLNFKVHGFEIKAGLNGKEEPIFSKEFHASGHVNKKDLLRIIEEIEPDVIIPVHTDSPSWFKNHLDNVKFIKEGQKYQF
ncbi:MAG: ribonuclease J [Promethearchaeota archaeon]